MPQDRTQAWPTGTWTEGLRSAFRSAQALIEALELNADLLESKPGGSVDLSPDFPVLVPQSFADRMTPGDPKDPLLVQVLSRDEERQERPGFVHDPLAETDQGLALRRAPGLIQKYRGRALVIAAQGCAVHCRYCFRRHFPYSENHTGANLQVLEGVRDDPSIREVILSGGDPLLLTDGSFTELLHEIEEIGHVETIRIHSRIPVVLPERATEPLLEALARGRTRKVLVIHANHPNELNSETDRALRLFRATGATLLNQSVLLRDVNDRAEVLAELSRKLFDQGVLPYYLHMPDRVLGTHHFFVEDEEARRLHLALRAELPGYLVPKLVRETPGEPYKTLL